MSGQRVLKDFVSEIDQFLQEFDKRHPSLSKTQQCERDKYQRIYHLRDATTASKRSRKKSKLWEGF